MAASSDHHRSYVLCHLFEEGILQVTIQIVDLDRHGPHHNVTINFPHLEHLQRDHLVPLALC